MPKSTLPSTARAVTPQPLNYRTNINFWHGRVLSLRAALAGVAYTLRTQPNAWIELAALSAVGVAGWWFGISALEWGLLGLTVAVVLALEAVLSSAGKNRQGRRGRSDDLCCAGKHCCGCFDLCAKTVGIVVLSA